MFGSLLSWSIDNGRGSTANFRATIIAEFIKTTHDAAAGITMSATPLLLLFSKRTLQTQCVIIRFLEYRLCLAEYTYGHVVFTGIVVTHCIVIVGYPVRAY